MALLPASSGLLAPARNRGANRAYRQARYGMGLSTQDAIRYSQNPNGFVPRLGNYSGIPSPLSPKPTDTAPVMATPGEEVIPQTDPRHIGNLLGRFGESRGLMDYVRSLLQRQQADPSYVPPIRHLTGVEGSQTMRVVDPGMPRNNMDQEQVLGTNPPVQYLASGGVVQDPRFLLPGAPGGTYDFGNGISFAVPGTPSFGVTPPPNAASAIGSAYTDAQGILGNYAGLIGQNAATAAGQAGLNFTKAQNTINDQRSQLGSDKTFDTGMIDLSTGQLIDQTKNDVANQLQDLGNARATADKTYSDAATALAEAERRGMIGNADTNARLGTSASSTAIEGANNVLTDFLRNKANLEGEHAAQLTGFDRTLATIHDTGGKAIERAMQSAALEKTKILSDAQRRAQAIDADERLLPEQKQLALQQIQNDANGQVAALGEKVANLRVAGAGAVAGANQDAFSNDFNLAKYGQDQATSQRGFLTDLLMKGYGLSADAADRALRTSTAASDQKYRNDVLGLDFSKYRADQVRATADDARQAARDAEIARQNKALEAAKTGANGPQLTATDTRYVDILAKQGKNPQELASALLARYPGTSADATALRNSLFDYYNQTYGKATVPSAASALVGGFGSYFPSLFGLPGGSAVGPLVQGLFDRYAPSFLPSSNFLPIPNATPRTP